MDSNHDKVIQGHCIRAGKAITLSSSCFGGKIDQLVYDSRARRQLELMPQGRGQTPEDMEQLAVFLATRPNMTGQCVNVDGSMVSHWAAVSSRHGGELAFSKGQAPGLALGLWKAFTAVPAISTASIRDSVIARADQSHQPHQHI